MRVLRGELEMEPGRLLSVSQRAQGDHLGGSPSNAQVQEPVTRMQAHTEEDALKLHLEECLCLAHEARGMVSWVGVAAWARAWQLGGAGHG